MKIERVEVRELALPLRYPFETSFGRTTRKQFLLVAVTAGGVTGYGECVADRDPYYLPETNGTVAHVLDEFLIPLLLQLEIAHPREVWPGLARVRGHEMAKASLDMAVWELWARREGVPLRRVLGGEKTSRRQQRLHARRRRRAARARPAGPDDDRAAAGLERHRGPRRAAA